MAPEERLLEAIRRQARAGGASDSPGDAEAAREREEAALHDLACGWRTAFVEALEPRHLPEGWTTDHRRPLRPDAPPV